MRRGGFAAIGLAVVVVVAGTIFGLSAFRSGSAPDASNETVRVAFAQESVSEEKLAMRLNSDVHNTYQDIQGFLNEPHDPGVTTVEMLSEDSDSWTPMGSDEPSVQRKLSADVSNFLRDLQQANIAKKPALEMDGRDLKDLLKIASAHHNAVGAQAFEYFGEVSADLYNHFYADPSHHYDPAPRYNMAHVTGHGSVVDAFIHWYLG
ncbi:hypothetical protein JI721_12205 [Alicyclobacillus cycloheptanicus]|uniref:Uncharacterized protein n=1 Tax=Alicyclobacillus cycloheptanicus TaxID=1457 RepID=A0ABT9XFN5_9BACL|nr:hypothetical protein [Alicyclobacillus cycloheptanicus]MDQ0188884.1 hypothetical protein [Alicyclobacillus cycloheptanicus]WDM00477.1 hypothetical protein JI721_12205 [Alicyclobacillus cycloheptanicus]